VDTTEFARLIVHDRRGSGASTRNLPPPNLETRADLALSRAAQRAGIPDSKRHTLTVDEELMRRYARVTRNTVSPDVAQALTQILWQTDVRDILPSVRAPTALVIGEGDATAGVEEAEYVASLMPNATVHVLSGRSGLQREAVMEIIRGLAGIERQQAVSTVLASVLFTDLVDSTRRQAELGDRRWKELLLAHHSLVRDALSDWGGT
jgi:class 3 adenylate cyclase